jgi:formate dehydrogenase maturation protein FdhE
MTLGFARLNNILGQNSNSCKYTWDGSNVALSSNQFDRATYLNGKFNKLSQKSSVLTKEEVREVIANIAKENEQLLNQIASVFGEEFQKLDAQFDFLLMAAFALKEHSQQLRSSQRNIERTRQADTWMCASEVNALMNLVNNRVSATDTRKFIQRDR